MRIIVLALLSSSIFASFAHADTIGCEKNSKGVLMCPAQAPAGWKVTAVRGLEEEDAAACKGRIVVEKSRHCKVLPPKYRGGPTGLRCSNKCVE